MVLVGTKLKKAKLDSRYDAIVIGSGMGGLSTAAVLSLAGKKTLVLERHYTAGGFTHSYMRKGFEWDVGVHYIGEVHKELSPMRQAFDLVSEGRLKWAHMGEVYDTIQFPDDRYEFRTGRERFRDDMKARFPDDQQAIDGYLREVSIVNNLAMPAYVSSKMAPGFLQGFTSWLTQATGLNYFQKSTGDVLGSLTQNQKLKGVLTGQWGDYGVPPAKSSFAMQALVANHYFDGGNFPVGGASNIARSILPTIQKSGGQVVTEAEVEEILVKNNQAWGVRLGGESAGQIIEADQIISAAGFNVTAKLLPEDTRARYGFEEKSRSLNGSIGHLGLFIGLKGSPSELGLPKNNLWLYPDYDHDQNMMQLQGPDSQFPIVYISFPSSKDPSWEKRHPGKSTIDVICPAPYDWFARWESTGWNDRGTDYDDFKAQLSERILEHVYRHVPAARGRIDYHELSTPLSTRHFCNYARGEVYGLDHTPDRFARPFLKPRTPVKGLFLTGQDILCCGVGSALAAGMMTATVALGARSMSLVPKLVVRWPQSETAPGADESDATENHADKEPATHDGGRTELSRATTRR